MACATRWCAGVALGLVAIAAPAASEAGPARMLKGPYLQNLAPTSMTVMWQLEPAQPAKLTLLGPAGQRVVDVPAARIAEADLLDLAPASRYRYRVEADGQSWDGEFATAPLVGARVPFSFVVLGDSRSNAESHRRVVERVAQEVPDFLLGTGDMVDDGARLEQWQTFFDIERELLADNVYFPSVGNHDRQGRGRTADTYRSFFSVPDNGGDSERYYSFDYANARVLVLDSNAHSFSLTGQTAWIERELSAARQDDRIRHLFVVMHHPPYSISLHGGQRDLRERWTPLFEKYGVSAVFSGHDHAYQRAERNGVRYFVTGGAGAPLYPRSPRASAIDKSAVQRFERAFHFLRVTVSAGIVNVTAVRVDGSVIESTLWSDGPEPARELPEAPPKVAARPAAGAVGAALAPPVRRAGAGQGSDSMLWLGMLGAATAMLGAVVFVRRARQ